MPEKLANALLFQAGWFACVIGGDSAWLLLALAVLALHVAWHGEARLLIEAFGLGVLLDSALMWAGVYDFRPSGMVIPLWLALLWPLFASTLRHCLAWTAEPAWLAAALGAVGGPLSYYAGSQWAGVAFPYGLWPTMFGLGLLWAMILPGLHWVARRSVRG
ncbi:MAG: DUF2878 domain-containing protein [Pseudomonas sp.]|uniref:DUF2878 domain-containing protein n=1 Tax=Pseudomonas abieticivorans TaxID=2931382 RepID=UPI0020BE3316|nr:DUF2878 domain-containing protein [Pseudomonas sp. PIA16]MDE1165057.1 DUF2878 domain-containing protein [Pseudomonas sp.]